MPGPMPLDVDTWADYEAVVAAAGQPLGRRSYGRAGFDRCEEKGVTRLTGWQVGIALGVVVILVAAVIVITIVQLARRIAAQAATAEQAVETVRAQTDALDGIGRINDSGVRILHSARALRKVAVGK